MMDNLQILNLTDITEKMYIPHIIKATKIELVPFKLPVKTIFGIDPGTTHLGVAELWQLAETEVITLYQINLERQKSPLARIDVVTQILRKILNTWVYNTKIVIEGAAFAPNYRQVELAEIRTAAIFWGKSIGAEILVPAPNSIRKKVFGNGKMSAHQFWSELVDYPDAAAALSCALYAI